MNMPTIAKIDRLTRRALVKIFKKDKAPIIEELWQITNDALQGSVTEVFGLDEVENPLLVTQLRTNAAVFSAFKAHAQGKVIRDLLVDSNGKVRSFGNFHSLAKKVADKWNKNWLQTEYNTALARARTADQFDRFRQTKKLYPNLKWIPSRSANPREGHRRLWGIVKPIDDPFWNRNFPGNIWNCKCSVQRTRQRATAAISRRIPKPARGIDENPVDGEFFTKTHPYIAALARKLARDTERYGRKKVNIRIQEETKQWAKANIPEQEGLTIKADNLQTGKLNLRRGSVKNILAHNVDPIVKIYPQWMQEDIRNWEYLGWSKVDQGKHEDTIAFLYYKRMIGNEERYINVKLTKEHGEVPYAVINKITLKKFQRGKIPKK